MTHETMSFEKAFERLEQILENMNEGKTPLQESLTLFEEAEKLIRNCTTRLTQAEQKIEMLIKGRNGEAILDANQKPQVQPYTAQPIAAAAPPIAPPVAPAYARSPAPAPKPAASIQSMDDLPF